MLLAAFENISYYFITNYLFKRSKHLTANMLKMDDLLQDKMEQFMCTLDDDVFDLDYYDSPIDYSDDVMSSPGSNGSDAENSVPTFSQCSYMKKAARTFGGKKVLQRKAANMRERRRMKSINDAFDILRKCIPLSDNVDRKLSKVDTLKLAMGYIRYLDDVIKTTNDFSSTPEAEAKEEKPNKIILRCHFAENDPVTGEYQTVMGHSLTWSADNPGPLVRKDNKYTAKIWFPDRPNEEDLLNLSTYSHDFGKIS